MLSLKLSGGRRGDLKILLLGAHSDDIEMGCGGTVLRFLDVYDGSQVHWVVFSANDERRAEAEKSADLFLAKASRKEIIVKDFKESFFPYIGGEIKSFFEELKAKISPDIVFTHYREDLHQDHRLISELTWNTFRDHLILEYEVIKYDADLGSPNLFVHLNENICRKKTDYIIESFTSQQTRQWFTEDVFLSILRIRGLESNAPERFAEGFYCRKLVV